VIRGVAFVSLVILGAAAVLVFVAIARGRVLADRAVAVDGLVAVLLNGLAVGAMWTGERAPVVLALVLSLLGFVGTTTIARYIERRGEDVSESDAVADGRSPA